VALSAGRFWGGPRAHASSGDRLELSLLSSSARLYPNELPAGSF
jgi:hypothetical protein